MGFLKNTSDLSSSPQRKKALELVEVGLESIQAHNVLSKGFVLNGDTLQIQGKIINLTSYENVFLIGFGKGAAKVSQIIEQTLGDKLTGGYVIDTVKQSFKRIEFTLGTHPLPSKENIEFTVNVLQKIKNLSPHDLVLVVICGGGSALFEAPYKMSLEKITDVFNKLLKSGANISEMNVVRKHLSKVKGGSLAKHLFPARVVSMVFSDVPGNDLTTIASGPTVIDKTTMADVTKILDKYEIEVDKKNFTDTAHDKKYFKNVTNIIMVSNMTALTAMEEKAKELGFKTRILSDRFQGNAKEVGKTIVAKTKKGEVLLVGGETTLKVSGKGQGGRNQTVVLSTLKFLENGALIVSVDSDGIDFTHFAGAIGDAQTLKKAKELGLNIQEYLDNDDSGGFFKKTKDGLLTDRLESNVADLMFVMKE